MRNEQLTGERTLVVARIYPASRELVFQAWSSAEHPQEERRE